MLADIMQHFWVNIKTIVTELKFDGFSFKRTMSFSRFVKEHVSGKNLKCNCCKLENQRGRNSRTDSLFLNKNIQINLSMPDTPCSKRAVEAKI